MSRKPLLLAVLLLPTLAVALFWYWPAAAPPVESTCYGTTADGRLEDGVRLPQRGENFVAYGVLPVLLGRTFVHSTTAAVAADAYAALAESHPDRVFQYAETGWPSGGPFPPHKTHRNGLSVDFMVPMVDPDGRSVHLPTRAWTRYGYDLELDSAGCLDELCIDYEALGAHLLALDAAARKHGVGVRRVIFDPQLQPRLLATRHGDALRRRIQLSTRRAWVRHDEHYHVDFAIPCAS